MSRDARIAIVFAGGDPVDPAGLEALPHNALHIAADGGLAQAAILGRTADVVIGDMDSVEPLALEAAERTGAEVVRHSRNKDATDLELALRFAIDHGCTRVLVVGGLGGRIDHLFGNALLLANAALEGIDVSWMTGDATITPVRPGAGLTTRTRPGDIVSLLPVAGAVSGIRTRGLEWVLDGDALTAGSTRGISNVAVAEEIQVSVENGVLLVLHSHRVEQ